jgi:DNA-binding winged helix-turn-helix (wHTH) protein
MPIFAFGEFELDEARFELRRAGVPFEVQPKILRLLCLLLTQRQRAVDADELLRVLWPGETVARGSVKRAVHGARRALGDSSESSSVIRTVRGHGYQFVGTVRELAAVPHGSFAAEASLARAGAHIDADEYVGREGLLAFLEEQLNLALAGQARCVLMAGEPGVGKTRTLQELSRRAAARGAHCWFARATELDGAPAFWPIVQILRQASAELSQDALRAAMGPGAADIAEAMPELREFLPELPRAPAIDSVSARFRFFDSMTRFLRTRAEQRPIVLLVDDLQSAGEPTLRLLAFLVRHIDTARVLVAGSARQASMREGGPAGLLAELAREPATRCAQIDGFSLSELGSYLERKLGSLAPRPALTTLHDQTAGNPLFLEQILGRAKMTAMSLFCARGEPRASTDEVHWTQIQSAADNTGLRGAIERHLEVLPAPTRALLRAAAAIGREFSLGLLLDLANLSSELLLAQLSEAADAGIVRLLSDGVGRYRFTHALIRDALYVQTPSAERASLHGRIGAALEARGAAANDSLLLELADHFVQAGPAHAGRALSYCLRAAEFARQRLAYEEAAVQLDRACQLLDLSEPNLQLRMELMLQKGEVLAYATDVSHSRSTLLEALALARTLGATDALVRAAMLLARPPESGIVDTVQIEVLTEAIEALSDDDPRRACLDALLAKALCYSGEFERRGKLARAALARVSALEPQLRSQTLSVCPEALAEPEYLPERISIADRLEELGRTLGDHNAFMRAATLRIWNALELGDYELADLTLESLASLSERVRDPLHRWYTKAFRAVRAFVSGRLSLAEQYALELQQHSAAVGEVQAYHVSVVQLAPIRRLQGRVAEAEAMVREASTRHPALAGWRALLADIEAQRGRKQPARAVLEQLMADDLQALRRDPFLLSALAPAADLCGYVGDARLAGVLYDAILPYEKLHANISVGFGTHGPVARQLGVLAARMGELASAGRHFEAAIDASEAIRSPLFVSVSCLSYARALQRSEQSGARELRSALLQRAMRAVEGTELLGLSWVARALLEQAPSAVA